MGLGDLPPAGFDSLYRFVQQLSGFSSLLRRLYLAGLEMLGQDWSDSYNMKL
jgi:hypothetical protein